MHLKQRSFDAKTMAAHEGQSQSPGRRGLSLPEDMETAGAGAGSRARRREGEAR